MTSSFKRIIVLFCLTAVLAFVSTGCHTAHGFGEDMQDAGQGIQHGTQ
ncbi:MAG TPA: entericidin A/B family lipoprotein [Verrucomicrobiae bacterium]|nr:entericidin A/B family lipoprotein [Verrucomicrobiae bacterium]